MQKEDLGNPFPTTNIHVLVRSRVPASCACAQERERRLCTAELGKTQEVNVSESGEVQSLKSARAWTQLLTYSLTDLCELTA